MLFSQCSTLMFEAKIEASQSFLHWYKDKLHFNSQKPKSWTVFKHVCIMFSEGMDCHGQSPISWIALSIVYNMISNWMNCTDELSLWLCCDDEMMNKHIHRDESIHTFFLLSWLKQCNVSKTGWVSKQY